MKFTRIAAVLAALVMAMVSTAVPASAVEIAVWKNMYTGKCLDDSEYGFRTYPCNDGIYQKWIVTRWNDGTQRFMNAATKRCIDDSHEFGLRTFGCNALKYQSFHVQDNLSHPFYRLMNQQTRRCLDDSPQYLRPWGCNNLSYQRWHANP